MKINPLLLTDGYKTSHRKMYPKNTSVVYSNYTCRSVKYMPEMCKEIVVFGTQYVFKQIHEIFLNDFFTRDKNQVCQQAKKILTNYLGADYDISHFEALHDLGYLPIKVKALEEGAIINAGIPLFTIVNTHPDFFWVTNFLETLISTLIWKPVHSASIAYGYRKILEKYAIGTGMPLEFVNFQGHDFSFRGMQSLESAISSGLGFLTSFMGTDTLPTLQAAEYYYDSIDVGFSVPASEHSVMCAHRKEAEIDTLKYLMNEYPTGILSVVSDTWNLWTLITEYLPQLKEEILSRDGKLVIRPDCYSEDTLTLTPDGWKEFNQLTPDSLVAQVNEDGSYSFVKPLKIVNEEYNGTMFHFKDFHGKMDLLVTPNHRMIYKQFNEWKVDFAEDCKPNNYTKFFIRSAKAENKYQILTNVERLNIAFQADGSKCTDTDKNIRFNFSKVRKIQRLKALLDDMKLSYKEYNLDDGRVEINVEYPLNQVSKNFDWVVTSDLCFNWCQEFIEELSHWDSCIRNDNRIKFDTTNFSVSQVVELIALSAGYGCLTSKYEDDRKEIFSDVYTSHISLDNKLGGQSITVNEIQYNGRIVCVTVPTGKIVVKRNRCTMVCGNSGDPVDIICGTAVEISQLNDIQVYTLLEKDINRFYKNGKYYESWYAGFGNLNCNYREIEPNSSEKGVIELLWDIFGGTVNEQGYKVLNPHIGAIYGDSITPERAVQIAERLKAKGFANQVVLGVGSYSLGYATRDSQGGAVKSTLVVVNGEVIPIFKDPITDDGTKKSAKGYLQITSDLKLKDECTAEEENQGLLEVIYEDGKFVKTTTFEKIRNRITDSLK